MKLGIIGLGTMGGILAQNLLKNKFASFEKYFFFDVDKDKLKIFSEYGNVEICDGISALIEKSEIILLAVKPQQMEKVLLEISKSKFENKTYVTIAAGLRIAYYRKFLNDKCFMVRVMPNILFSVGEGAAGMTIDPNLSKDIAEIVQNIFKTSGRVILCEEKNLDVVTGLSGSGPAYLFMVIEAMADGAVKMGLPRKEAYILAAQTLVGAGKMVLETNSHPGLLKDMVCTPGGTTIDALSMLERGKMRSLFIDAVEVATKKSQSLSPPV